jgi:hypothetical protein
MSDAATAIIARITSNREQQQAAELQAEAGRKRRDKLHRAYWSAASPALNHLACRLRREPTAEECLRHCAWLMLRAGKALQAEGWDQHIPSWPTWDCAGEYLKVVLAEACRPGASLDPIVSLLGRAEAVPQLFWVQDRLHDLWPHLFREAGSTGQTPEDDDPDAGDLLLAMLKLGAFGKRSRQKRATITKHLGAKKGKVSHRYAHAFPRLNQQGFIDSKRGVGICLTPAGEQRARELQRLRAQQPAHEPT